MIFLIYVIFYLKDPDASYDVNDRDPDPQPRYTQLNDNRYEFLSRLFLCRSNQCIHSRVARSVRLQQTCHIAEALWL